MCKQPIKGGRVVDAKDLGGKVHVACFSCVTCSKQLSGTPYKVHGGVLYCSPCHANEHGEKCTACGKPITGGMMKCSLGTFHVECLICSNCGKAIGKAKFSTAGGVMSCNACAPGAGGAAPKAKAKAGVKASPKGKATAKAKISMSGAHSSAMGMAMDYADL